MPQELEVTEAGIENASSLRSPDLLLVTEGFNTAIVPSGALVPTLFNLENSATRKLEWKGQPQDARILRKANRKVA